jgi:hypothetical protein
MNKVEYVFYTSCVSTMPIDENGAANSSSNPTSNTSTNPQNTASISDLGDILLDKSLDSIQKNDFVPVSKSDVVSLEEDEETPVTTSNSESVVAVESTPLQEATIEDLQNIMLDNP